MNIDLSQFDNLELENIGQWPRTVKVVTAILIVVAMLFAGYHLFIVDRIKQLNAISTDEKNLRQSFQTKYHVSANLGLFRQQMIDAEALFSEQVKSLPERHETPGLLDDITFVGTSSGLQFETLSWQPEVFRDIYIELPINIEVMGTYHQFGQFVSEVAGLSRIVTLHDFAISQVANSDNLHLSLKAKTYRYRKGE